MKNKTDNPRKFINRVIGTANGKDRSKAVRRKKRK